MRARSPPRPPTPTASRSRAWPSRGPARAVILALHGFGDAGDLTYDGAAAYWAGRGIAVYALDQRGFGGNASRKQWPGIDALIADATAAARDLRRRHPGLPLVVVGHSMGGGVALAAAAEGMDADAPGPRRPRHRRRRRAEPARPRRRLDAGRGPARHPLDRPRPRRDPAHRQSRRRSAAPSPTRATSATPPAASSTASSR